MQKSRLFFVIAAAAAIIILGILPRTKAPNEQAGSAAQGVDQRVQEAMEIVQSGQNPMQGVQMLREILEEDPDNIQATYALGVLSMQSGQFDKAVQRLTRVLEIDPHQHQALRLRADAFIALGDTAQAIADLNELLQHEDDPKLDAEVNQILNELKK